MSLQTVWGVIYSSCRFLSGSNNWNGLDVFSSYPPCKYLCLFGHICGLECFTQRFWWAVFTIWMTDLKDVFSRVTLGPQTAALHVLMLLRNRNVTKHIYQLAAVWERSVQTQFMWHFFSRQSNSWVMNLVTAHGVVLSKDISLNTVFYLKGLVLFARGRCWASAEYFLLQCLNKIWL